MKDHIASQVTTLCTCWKITRVDKKVFGFTDHDVDLTIDGLTYNASSGFFRSAISNTATTAADNLEVKGFLDDSQITEEELRNGAFDFATVEIFAVNWRDLSQGIIKLRYGIFGETTQSPSGLFTVELRGLTQLFSQTIGELFTAACRADLGDSRCKVNLVPEVRVGNKSYAVGDRVLCLVDGSHDVRVRLPMQNPNFEELTSETNVFGWSLNNTLVIDNYTYRNIAGPGNWLKPIQASASTYQNIDLDRWFRVNTYARTGNITVNMSLRVFHNSIGWRARIALNHNNTRVYSDWSTYDGVTTPQEQTISLEVSFPSGESFMRPEIYIERVSTAPSDSEVLLVTDCLSQIDLDGDDVTGALYWINQHFDYFIGSCGQARAWKFDGPGYGTLMAASTVMSPYSGTFYLMTGSTSMPTSTYHQRIPLASAGVDLAVLDNSGYDLEWTGLITAIQRGSKRDVIFKFYNASEVLMSTVSLGAAPVTLVRNWQQTKFRTLIPSGARFVEVYLWSGLDDGGAYVSTIFDQTTLDVVNLAYETTTEWLEYGGVEYKCITAGTTASVSPLFHGTVGETVNDGTVVWQGIFPKHTTVYAVASATDHKHFTVSTSQYGEAKPADWFTWGVVEFLSGKNIGRKVEVLSYTHPNFTTALSLPYVPQSGDLLRVHTGCDKRRATCRDKFANIINMRGEPDLPGSGAYFKIGVAK